MEKVVGTVVRGLRAPIFKAGDDLVQMIPDLLDRFFEQENIEIGKKDVVAITESVVARTQGNYVTIDQVAKDLNQKPLCYSSKSHCKRRCREGNSSAFTSIRRGWKPLDYTRPARQRRYQPLERDYLRG